MRAYVFSDAALAKQAGRFVWLSIDTENERNADFLARYPMESWPTLFVIDAEWQKAVLKWPGSANPTQLVKLLDDGVNALEASRPEGEAQAIARADRLGAEGRTVESVEAYREALRVVPEDKRPRLVESLVLAQAGAHDFAGCSASAIERAPSLPRGPSFANVVATGLYCAEAAGKVGTDALTSLLPLGEEALALPGLLADDRSGIYEVVVAARAQRGDEKGARALAREWLAFLDEQSKRAPSAEARAAFDPARVGAAVAAGDATLAIAALQQSERDLPRDYNASLRLAQVYQKLERFDDALGAADRALGRAYGPRRVKILDLKATLLERKGDRDGARRVLQEALQTAGALPAAQHHDEAVAHEKTRIEALDEPISK